MDTHQFDTALVAAMFRRAGLVGWPATTLVDAARDAELDLPRVRLRFPGKSAALLRFGTQADQAALSAAPTSGSPREKLFDLLMSRFDQLQLHRDGVLALMQALPADPATALLLAGGTLRSMRWMLDAAGVPTGGLVGALRVQGLVAVWAYAMRAWQADEGGDLPATMAAMDRALDRAMQAEEMLPGGRRITDAPPMDAPPDTASATDASAMAASAMDVPPAYDPPVMLSGAAIAADPDGPAVL